LIFLYHRENTTLLFEYRAYDLELQLSTIRTIRIIGSRDCS